MDRLGAAKRIGPGGPARVLLAVIHLLLELFGFLLVHKAQSSQAFLELEGVEEGPVLIIMPCVENLLIPDDAAGGWLERQVSGWVVKQQDADLQVNSQRYRPFSTSRYFRQGHLQGRLRLVAQCRSILIDLGKRQRA